MLQISADLMVLSQSQREALAAFITTFPSTAATEADPVIPCPIVEVDRSFWTPEEQAEEQLPVFDAPLPAGVLPFPTGGPSQVDPPTALTVTAPQVPIPAGLSLVTPSNLDKNGLPWDDRIHASSKAKTQDGSWRTKRGVDAGLLAAVQAELRGVMGLPTIPTGIPGGLDKVHNVRIETTPFPPPPAVPAAAAVPSITSSPVVSAPTVAPAVSPVPFISLVSFAGAKSLEGKLSDAEIEAACKAVGVNSLTLMTNRHDLCPYVEASLRQLVASR